MKDLFDKMKEIEKEPSAEDINKSRDRFVGNIRRRNFIIDLLSAFGPGGCIFTCAILAMLIAVALRLLGY